MKAPTDFDRMRLVRLVRYLTGTRTFGVLRKKPKGEPGIVKMDMYSDTDFANCKETRRAMMCSDLRLDGVPSAGFARRHAVQSTSSGEAEFYGAGSVVMDGLVVKYVLQWLGYKVEYVLLLDSSAAKAMVQRDGVGKAKHPDVRALWLQAERRDHGLIAKNIPG